MVYLYINYYNSIFQYNNIDYIWILNLLTGKLGLFYVNNMDTRTPCKHSGAGESF